MTEEINNGIEIIVYDKIENFENLLEKLDKNYTKSQLVEIKEKIPLDLLGLEQQIIKEILKKTEMDKRKLNKIFKEYEEKPDVQISISQIEKHIAKLITDKYKIITFEETDEICLYKNGVFLRNTISRANIRKEILKIVNKDFDEYNETLSKRGMIIEFIKNMTFYPMEEFGLKADIINLKNGIILYKDGKLKFTPHNILEDRNIILYTFIQFPIYFDKTAKCPTINKVLLDIFGKDQLIDIMEFVSYILVPTLRFDKALMLHGPTKTGETTFLNLLKRHFLGRNNISQLELYRLAKRFQVENLRFKVANISDDLAPLPFRHSACSWIKKLITNRYLEGELKIIQGNKAWINICKLVCACNKIPEPEDKTDAWWTRWIGISCVNQFIIGKNRDDKYKDMEWSKEEMSGLLNKCLIAWIRLNKRGGFREKWQDPDFVKLWWMSNIDPVAEFVNKFCNVGNSWQSIDYEEFINKFNNHRKERGLKELSKSLITRGLKGINNNIAKKKINIQSNPESSGHSYTHIGWAEITDKLENFIRQNKDIPEVKDKVDKWEKIKLEGEKRKRAFKDLEDGEEVDHADIFEPYNL